MLGKIKRLKTDPNGTRIWVSSSPIDLNYRGCLWEFSIDSETDITFFISRKGIVCLKEKGTCVWS